MKSVLLISTITLILSSAYANGSKPASTLKFDNPVIVSVTPNTVNKANRVSEMKELDINGRRIKCVAISSKDKVDRVAYSDVYSVSTLKIKSARNGNATFEAFDSKGALETVLSCNVHTLKDGKLADISQEKPLSEDEMRAYIMGAQDQKFSEILRMIEKPRYNAEMYMKLPDWVGSYKRLYPKAGILKHDDLGERIDTKPANKSSGCSNLITDDTSPKPAREKGLHEIADDLDRKFNNM